MRGTVISIGDRASGQRTRFEVTRAAFRSDPALRGEPTSVYLLSSAGLPGGWVDAHPCTLVGCRCIVCDRIVKAETAGVRVARAAWGLGCAETVWDT